MSAYGYKRTFTHTLNYVRFTPESGRKTAGALTTAPSHKRTLVGKRKRRLRRSTTKITSAMLNGSQQSCRLTGEVCPDEVKTAKNGPTEATWLDEARPGADKITRSSMEVPLLLQWHDIWQAPGVGSFASPCRE